MKTILVPCDFSKPAVQAFRYAIDLASRSRGTVHVLHIVELPVLHDAILMPVLTYEATLLKELEEGASTEFNKLIAEYGRDDVNIIAKTEFGNPSTMILDYLNVHHADLVVMGSHGAGGLREMIVGSNAEKIVRRSPVPVLVLKEYPAKKISNIVFPNTLDTEHQEELVSKVKELQDFFKAQLHIVYINTPVNFIADNITRDRLELFVKRFMLQNCTINIFNHQDEEDGIRCFARMVDADMIAMGTHGRRGLSHLVNGSLAEDVVNHEHRLIWTYSLKHQLVAS